LATNRAFDLDEAMHRRITLAVEFRQPDHLLRDQIWKAHIPPDAKFDEKIDWKYLSIKYELTGGFIKNAILAALSTAVSRDKENILITQKDLEDGALHQLRGRLAMVDFDRRVVPTKGLDSVIASKEVCQKLQQIINFEKARQILFGEWGFNESSDDQGTSCLFYGPPGTGKTLAAKAIGFETGKPLKIVNCAELVSKWVGETGKNIEAIFKEARSIDAILVFDEAEGMFARRSSSSGDTASDRYANLDTGLLLYHLERFPGIVILTSNLMDNIDSAFFRRLRFVINFALPELDSREKLWQSHIPSATPIHENVDFKQLASRFKFSGGNIKNCVFKAAATAALRFDVDRKITMQDLQKAAEDEEKAQGIDSKLQQQLYV